MLNARFINDRAPILFRYALMSETRRKIDHFQVQVSAFEDHRLNLTIVHDSPSTGAGPDVALFQKLEDCELSDKVFVLEGRHQK